MDIYVYNPDLEQLGIIDQYKSLIWANRYKDLGDCELYVPATEENLNLLQVGNYLRRLDDDMICLIKRRELSTDVETGDYITVTAQDAKCLLDQRIVNQLYITKRTAYYFLTHMITDFCIDAGAKRSFKKSNGNALLALDSTSGAWDGCDITASWENVGEKTREICDQFGYGYKAFLDDANAIIKIKVYKGTDRSANVIFSDAFENLASTEHDDDATNMGNVFRVCGEGEGYSRTTILMGDSNIGIDRYEVYVDARDISRSMSGSDLKTNYPGEVAQDGSGNYYWKVDYLNIPIYTPEQLAELQITHPGGAIITYSYKQYYQLRTANVATLSKSTLDDSDTVDVNDLIYLPFLYQRGAEKSYEYGRQKTFTGEISNVTFYYKEDYFLGDIVTVINAYGITAQARVIEVIEVDDNNGYRIEPTFEFRSVD